MGDDDWDLQAVVRGCNSTTTAAAATTKDGNLLCGFPPLSMEEGNEPVLLCFPDLLEKRNAFEELEELYKPFFPKLQPLSPQRFPTTTTTTTTTSSFPAINGGFKDQLQQQQEQPQRSLAGSTQSQTPRSKRRKNQQKKVVRQVPAEGLSSDVWAWRKYGQKPIKGSPYPRGYYRCSSSKGCLARKQVERCRTDPAMFIVTYTADHNHPVPTHRNSLAGSTRQKLPTLQRTTTTSGDPETPTTSKPTCSSPISVTGLSPTTPLTASIEDEVLRQSNQDCKDEEDAMVEEDEDFLIPDMVMVEDLFMDLEALSEPIATSTVSPDFDDCFSDHFTSAFPPSWFANNAATSAGGR